MEFKPLNHVAVACLIVVIATVRAGSAQAILSSIDSNRTGARKERYSDSYGVELPVFNNIDVLNVVNCNGGFLDLNQDLNNHSYDSAASKLNALFVENDPFTFDNSSDRFDPQWVQLGTDEDSCNVEVAKLNALLYPRHENGPVKCSGILLDALTLDSAMSCDITVDKLNCKLAGGTYESNGWPDARSCVPSEAGRIDGYKVCSSPEETCAPELGLQELTASECVQAAATIFRVDIAFPPRLINRDWGTDWPHGCWSRNNERDTESPKIVFNTGGTNGTNTVEGANPLRICGLKSTFSTIAASSTAAPTTSAATRTSTTTTASKATKPATVATKKTSTTSTTSTSTATLTTAKSTTTAVISTLPAPAPTAPTTTAATTAAAMSIAPKTWHPHLTRVHTRPDSSTTTAATTAAAMTIAQKTWHPHLTRPDSYHTISTDTASSTTTPTHATTTSIENKDTDGQDNKSIMATRLTLATGMVLSAVLSFILLTVAGKKIYKSRMKTLFKNDALSRTDDAAVFLIDNLEYQGGSGGAASTAVTAFGLPTTNSPQPQPQSASAPATETLDTPSPPPIPPTADVKLVYAGNGRLVSSNNFFEAWVLDLHAKDRNCLARELNLADADKKALKEQTKRYQLKLSQRRSRERGKEKERQRKKNEWLQNSPLDVGSDDSNSPLSVGSTVGSDEVPFLDWRQRIVGSDSPLSVGSTVGSDDGSACSALHGSSVQPRDWQQTMAGSDSPFSFGSDASSSSHGFGSGLSADLGDLFTESTISRDAFQGTQFPQKVHFTQSHNNTVAPFEFDGVDGAGLPASEVLKMLEAITAERSGTNYN